MPVVNRGIGERLAGTPDVLLDVDGMAETVGLAEWYDERCGICALPFASAVLPIYAELVCRNVAALRGKSRKCLVLDLDNTLWGGVIGDDGLGRHRARPGQRDAARRFLAVQRLALDLRERGVMLAVCSKNDDAIARGCRSASIPRCCSSEEHIAVFLANWTDKATQPRGDRRDARTSASTRWSSSTTTRPSARRFARDAAAGRGAGAAGRPGALSVRMLASAGYFEAVAFADEDRQRARSVRGQRRSAPALDGQIARSRRLPGVARHGDARSRRSTRPAARALRS